jgi:type III restriction enzyme
MVQIVLQRMLDALPDGSLPPNWRGFDLCTFSRDKSLWDYQQEALRYALKALWKYYGEGGLSTAERKENFYQWYRDFGMDQDLDIPLDKSSAAKRRLAALQETYYTSVEDRLPYAQFINSICFWMATGSGKTLVIVKLVELLDALIQRGEIPKNDILILAHRDDLLEQLRAHINDYNTSGSFYIRLQELRDYSEVKREQPNLFSENERTIFYYRSDNLSDEQKEKIIDFRNYDNHGRWYILLDEAHKGDREDSKRQQIYAILSRNGFMFNFSATFTVPREIITTAYNFNLSEYIRKGYGKHIYIFEQETRAFRKNEDFTESEKQKIVLKALLLLTAIKKLGHQVRAVDARLYHRPLLMALVNSVNTKDADLKLLFRELVRIANGDIDAGQWRDAKDELTSEIAAQPHFIYEPGTKLRVDRALLEGLTQADLLGEVFNASVPGQIEILFRPSDRKEVAFKMKTSEEAFALIRIGDVSEWLSQELAGYEVNRRFSDEGFFDQLNHPNSSINLLLGSRSFYEGWDSNRPNVIMYINIGTGTDARKFILQSVGRGARIQPLPDYRKRFAHLYTGGVLSEEEAAVYQQVKGDILPLEGEFIFGTNRDAMTTVIDELDQQDELTGSREISLKLNQDAVDGRLLLVPVFKQEDRLLYHRRNLAKFALSEDNLKAFKDYMAYLDDDRLLLALYDAAPKQIESVRESLEDERAHYRTDGPHYKNISVLTQQVFQYLSLHAKTFEKFKALEDEINHFRHVRVFLPEVEFEDFDAKLQEFYTNPAKIAELRAKYDAHQLPFEEIRRQVSALEGASTFSYKGQEVAFKEISQHYYLPLLISEEERVDYLRNVITVRSELRFLEKLERELAEEENPFKKLDWWLFSKIDENRDHIHIPYYYPYENRIAEFRPDFIFWMQKGKDYTILFVDPKGTGRSEYQHKVDGFRALFEEDEAPKVFKHGDLNVRVRLFLFTQDRQWTPEYYQRYWLDDVGEMVRSVIT